MMQNQPEKTTAEGSGFKRSKILRIITSALLAFCLWFYVISVERTETEQEFNGVEVVLDGEAVLEAQNLKIISEKDMKVKIKLNGRRSVLNKLRSSDITVRVDLTRIKESGTKNLPYEIEFPGDVQSSLIEVVSRNPDAITLTVADWAKSRVDLLEPEITGTPAAGYRLGTGIIQNDETVSISGPKEIIEKIHSAGVVVNVEGATATQYVTAEFLYYDEDGNQIKNTESVTAHPTQTGVTVPILQEKTVDMKLPLTIDPDVKDSRLNVSVVVELLGGEKQSYSSTILVEDGNESISTSLPDENGKYILDLGQVVAAGAGNSIIGSVTEAKLPTLELSHRYEGEYKVEDIKIDGGYCLRYSAEDIDLWKDEVRCDITSVTVTVTTEEKVSQKIPGVRIENVPDNAISCTPSMLEVEVFGFAGDLAGIDKSNIQAFVSSEVTQSGDYDVSVQFVDEKNYSNVDILKGTVNVVIEMPEIVQTVDPLPGGTGDDVPPDGELGQVQPL